MSKSSEPRAAEAGMAQTGSFGWDVVDGTTRKVVLAGLPRWMAVVVCIVTPWAGYDYEQDAE